MTQIAISVSAMPLPLMPRYLMPATRVLLLLLLAPALCAGLCGDGVVEPGEACDDANHYSGDGCSAACALEAGFLCSTRDALTSCCPALWNPVRNLSVCSCLGQASGSALYALSAACERVDSDECAVGNGGCAVGAVCVNLDGTVDGSAGFACECPPGRYGAACEPVAYAVRFELALYNTSALSLAELTASVGTALEAPVYVSFELSFAPQRRLLSTNNNNNNNNNNATNSSYAHLVVVLEAASWDAMQALAAAVNAAQVAAFLAAETPQLAQIAVLQETTTVVSEAPGAYTFAPAGVPGFLLQALGYVAERDAWLLDVRFFAPAVHALFMTKAHRAAEPAAQACVLAGGDPCCVRDMRADHYLGEFGAWADALCAGAALPRSRWIEGFGLASSGAALAGAGLLRIELAQSDVAGALAEARVAEDRTYYAFGVGMLFLAPHVTVAQVALEVAVSDSLLVVVAAEQHHGFLEHLDCAVYDILDSSGGRLRFVRVTMVAPPDVLATLVSPDSVEVALTAGAWAPACPSPIAARYAAAGARECALPDMQLCATRAAGGVYVLDVPVGVNVTSALDLRFAVQGERGGFELLSQVSVQLLAATAVALCAEPVQASAGTERFANVTVAIGTRLAGEGAVVVSDVLGSAAYTGGLLNIATQHVAASALDSLVLLVLEGAPAFFAAHPLNRAVFDHVLTVHLLSPAKVRSPTIPVCCCC